jgi:NTP pyrophosphatase (non-canonical NTP hydrolase)
MNFNAYQAETRKTAIYPNEYAFEYLLYGLVSEVGELAGKIKKIIRDSDDFTEMQAKLAGAEHKSLLEFQNELGDILWYVAQIADEWGLLLDDVARANIEKLQSRQARNALHGSGDDR